MPESCIHKAKTDLPAGFAYRDLPRSPLPFFSPGMVGTFYFLFNASSSNFFAFSEVISFTPYDFTSAYIFLL